MQLCIIGHCPAQRQNAVFLILLANRNGKNALQFFCIVFSSLNMEMDFIYNFINVFIFYRVFLLCLNAFILCVYDMELVFVRLQVISYFICPYQYHFYFSAFPWCFCVYITAFICGHLPFWRFRFCGWFLFRTIGISSETDLFLWSSLRKTCSFS